MPIKPNNTKSHRTLADSSRLAESKHTASQLLAHPFPPSAFGAESRVLILGSFPSHKSREMGFYYQHPRNRFWQVLARIYACDMPRTKEGSDDVSFTNKIHIDSSLDSSLASLDLPNVSNIDSMDSRIRAQKAFLKAHNIVLWDIVRSCSIKGSSDTSMSDITPNDLSSIVSHMPSLALIVLNGTKATEIFARIYGFYYDKKASYPRILTRYTKYPNKSNPNSNRNNQARFKLDFDGKVYALPSTSPANASFSLERLYQAWRIISPL